MVKIDLNKLNTEEQVKLARIAKMLKVGLPAFVPETKVLDERIDFIRKYGGKNYLNYPESWYKDNEERTSAIYFRVRSAYFKNYKKEEKILHNASESAKKLLAKAVVQETVKA